MRINLPYNTQHVWTEVSITQLKSMYELNLSYKEIGTVMRLSRGQVAGGIRRHLHGDITQEKIVKPAKIKSETRQNGILSINFPSKCGKLPKEKPIIHKPVLWPPAIGKCLCVIGESKSPVLACGLPCRPGKPYCADHCEQFYVKLTPKTPI